MNIKKMMQSIVISTCCAFTIEVLSFLILPSDLIPIINEDTIAKTLILSFLGASAVILTMCIHFKSIWTFYLVSFCFLTSTIFGVGSFILNLIPLEQNVWISVFCTLIFVYCIAYFVMYDKNKNDAELINRHLQNRKDTKE